MLTNKGFTVLMKPKSINIYYSKTLISETIREGKLAYLKIDISQARTAASKLKPKLKPFLISVWHNRLIYLNEDNIQKLKEIADGIAVKKDNELKVCEYC